MHHIVFITLSGFRIHEQELLAYGMTLPGFHDRANALTQLPALGLLTLAGMMPSNWTSTYKAPALVDEAFLEAVLAESPTLVAISALTASVDEAYALSNQLRLAGIQTVLGGLHVSACPDEAARHADAIIVGSGEPVWNQVIADATRRALQPVYRAPRKLPETDWVLPRIDLLGPVSRYTLQTQRGCPFACDFCAASRLLERFREKPIQLIRRELSQINKLDSAPLIELADDNTFAGNRDADELFEALHEANARWFTESDWRIGERPELLKKMAGSGCAQVLVGIESMVFRYPGMGDKLAEMNRMIDACTAIQEAGVSVNACFIIGAEGETQASVDRLTEFLLQAPFAEIQLTLQTPFPGTVLRERLKKEGRLISERRWPYYTLFEVTYHPDKMSVGDLELAFRESATHVYGPTATRRRKRIRLDTYRNNPRFNSRATAN
ncbi:B12-binding domain-containing radical SAM protein [Planctomicrobium sp. SH668]|uniref:B12-binding domain-containing radical SAM protein n=1 Tax=Planctomicrobium sp. SH668 TaxID=3448126 RepID=UPI003F5C2493